MSKKYRPYFTLQELHTILTTLKADGIATGLIRYLDRYIIDIERGTRTPNHVGNPSLAEKLGFSPDEKEIPDQQLIAEQAYYAWTTHPAQCSPATIAIARRHAYENDLLTPEQEQAYEHEQGIIWMNT